MKQTMQAVVMAGGFGTRLRPLTYQVPKPMVPIVNRPVLEHLIGLLARHGFQDLYCMIYFKDQVIKNYFKNGKSWNVSINYLKPDADLGTAGCVRFASSHLKPETLLVISGDLLTDINLTEALRFHHRSKAKATMVLTPVANPLPYGVVLTNAAGRIERFLEKPSWGEVFSDTINAGIYLLEPEVLEEIPTGQSFDFARDLFPWLLEQKVPIYGYTAGGYWKDIGDLVEYRAAHQDLLNGAFQIALRIPKRGQRIHISEGAILDEFSFIGDQCSVGPGCKIIRSTIGNGVAIGAHSYLEDAIVWSGCRLGKKVKISRCVLAGNVTVEDFAELQEGVVLAENSFVGKGALVRSGAKVWPDKRVEEGSVLSTSLIWGERWSKSLFGAYGITGLGNVEVTPEFAARLGAAYGSYLGKGAYVITSRDAHPASRMIKRSLISGLMSVGVRVGDLRSSPVPVVRFQLGREGEAGGVHVRQSPLNPGLMDVRFFTSGGRDLSVAQEKAIEQLFFREDFARPLPSGVGELVSLIRAEEYYRDGFLKCVQRESLRQAKWRIVLDYSNSSAALVLPQILGELGVDVVALNAHLNTTHIAKNRKEFESSLKQLSNITVSLKADAGFLMDTGAEKLFLVDDAGNVIPENEALALVAHLVAAVYPNKTIGIPVNASSQVEEAVLHRKMTVLRMPTAARHQMDFAGKGNAAFVGDGVGGFIFPEFQPAFDAMYATVKILELLAVTGSQLRQLRSKLPAVHSVEHQRLFCPWNKKGNILRKALADLRGHRLELIDGIRLRLQKGWVLLMPDPDEPFFHVYVQSMRGAGKKLLQQYVSKINEWAKN